MQEHYNGLVWEIDEIPNGSSSADFEIEFTHAAKAECPECGSAIFGTAHIVNDQLEHISYFDCECEDDMDEWDDDQWDDEDDEFEDGGVSASEDLVRDFIEVVQTNQKFNLND